MLITRLLEDVCETSLDISGVAMGCAGCAMHKGPAVRGPSEGPTVESVFLLSDTECSQINWNLRFSTCTNSTVVLALKEAERQNCWFSNQLACHTHRGSSFNWCMSDVTTDFFWFEIEGGPGSPSKLCTRAPRNLATPLLDIFITSPIH